jgi:ankyrin repeat protein
MEIEDLLDLIELILTQKGDTGTFTEDIIEKNFVLDRETLFIATQMRQFGLVRFVLKSGVRPTLESFQYAAEHEFFELCRLFVEFGSRKILSTPELETELKTNLLNGHLENFKNLINRGIDPTTEDNFSIQWASHMDYLKIISFLVEHGTDSIAKNKALQIASEGGCFEIVIFLINKGADPTTHDNICIQMASACGHLKIVSLFLKYGADPTADDNYAIQFASENGHLEVVRLLLENDYEYKVDPTADDNYAIRQASREGHLEIVQLLLKHGADPTAEDNDAIKWASMNGHLEVVRLLLNNKSKYKVDPKAGDNFAIKNASGPDKIAIIKLLKRYGAKL